MPTSFSPALTAGLVLALLSAGLWNAILVVAVAMLLICNPWIRTLLELPSTDGQHSLGNFDPARYLLSYTSSSTADQKDATKEDDSEESTLFAAGSSTDSDPLMQTDQLYSLTVMPEALRESSQTMIRFVVRDFVQGWYDPLTFGHPNFPSQPKPISLILLPASTSAHDSSRAPIQPPRSCSLYKALCCRRCVVDAPSFKAHLEVLLLLDPCGQAPLPGWMRCARQCASFCHAILRMQSVRVPFSCCF